jgi:hypothetical protein
MEVGIQRRLMSEVLIVYGARCVWWDSIDKASQLPNGLPCCPHCKSVLLQQMPKDWEEGMAQQELKEPGYTALLAWMRGKCFADMIVAREAYARRET